MTNQLYLSAEIVSLELLFCAAVTFLWGIDSLAAAWLRTHCQLLPHHQHQWQHVVLCWVQRLWQAVNETQFWLGVFLLVSDAILYAFLGINVIHNQEENVEWWAVLWFFAGAAAATMAFFKMPTLDEEAA